jgi:prepilin-type N-terminal cleavage/methylation domain-containing protein
MSEVTITRLRRQRGYSLPEMLVVVAIIGIISLVLVPNFITLQRSSKMKTAVRSFTTRLRQTQQLAITSHSRWKLKLTLNTDRYTTFREDVDPATGTATWVRVGPTYRLEEKGTGSPRLITFETTGFPDADSDGTNVIIFNPNGTVPPPASPNQPIVTLLSPDKIPKPQYTITISLTGSIKAT